MLQTCLIWMFRNVRDLKSNLNNSSFIVKCYRVIELKLSCARASANVYILSLWLWDSQNRKTTYNYLCDCVCKQKTTHQYFDVTAGQWIILTLIPYRCHSFVFYSVALTTQRAPKTALTTAAPRRIRFIVNCSVFLLVSVLR